MELIERWLFALCSTILRILHLGSDPARIQNLMQFIKFGIVGASNTALAYVLNIGVLLLLKSNNFWWDYLVGNLVSFIVSVAWSYFWNSRFVFHQKNSSIRECWLTLIKTYLAYGFTGIVLNNILSWIWIERLGISKFIAPLINLIISVPVNFLINKFWTFKTQNNGGSFDSL